MIELISSWLGVDAGYYFYAFLLIAGWCLIGSAAVVFVACVFVKFLFRKDEDTSNNIRETMYVKICFSCFAVGVLIHLFRMVVFEAPYLFY